MTELSSLGLTAQGFDNFIPRVMRKRLTAHFHNFSITSSRSRVVNHRVGLCVIKINGHLGKLRELSSRGVTVNFDYLFYAHSTNRAATRYSRVRRLVPWNCVQRRGCAARTVRTRLKRISTTNAQKLSNYKVSIRAASSDCST